LNIDVETLDALALGALQGIAEFLPISSSGHLVLGRNLLGLGDIGIRLDVFLHVGTLAAVFAFYREKVFRLVGGVFRRGEEGREDRLYALKIVLSAVPAGIVGILLKDCIETAFASPKAVAMSLMFTGVILSATKLLPQGRGGISFLGALWMGVAQAVAILPGVSRSGMTLSAARAGGVDAEKAAEFSFLMSAPPIAGAALLEIMKACRSGAEAGQAPEMSWGLCVVGALVSAVVGYYALKLLLKSLRSDKFWLFGPYCFIAGIVVLAVR